MEIAETNPDQPVRVLIYGVEGIGKSTFGAKSLNPIFITPEAGINQLTDAHGKPLKYFKGLNGWKDIIGAVRYLIDKPHNYETLVFDSIDWGEKAAHKDIIGSSGRSIMTVNGGYGAGLRESENMHNILIGLLNELQLKKRMNVVLVAHAMVKEVKDPNAIHDYDSYQIKCHDLVSSLWREWVDALLFANFATYTKEGETKRARAFTDGKRIVFTEKQPAFQAKNRYGLPAQMDFTLNFWNEFYAYARKGKQQETPEQITSEIRELYKHLKDKKIKDGISSEMKNAKNDINLLLPIRERVRQIVGSLAA